MGELPSPRGRRRAGEEFDVEITTGETMLDGRSLFSVVVRDVDDQRSAEDSSATGSRRIQALLRNASDGIAVFDAEGVLTYQSPFAERLTGKPLVGHGSSATTLFVHPDDSRGQLAADGGGLCYSGPLGELREPDHAS